MSTDHWAKTFPVLRSSTYLNTATSGLLGEHLLEWRQEHDLDFLIGGSEAKSKTHLILKETRETIGTCFNFKGDHIALVPSFSQGLNLLLEGLSVQEKILLLKGDYPSLNWPFESRGFSIGYLEIGSDLEEQIYDRIKNEKYTVFACSVVQWLNGIKIDFEFIKKLKADFPDLLIIMDGTQFCGSEQFDFNTSGIDVIGASGYKWLLSGYGNAFLMIKPAIQDRFQLKSTGFGSGRNATYQKDGRNFCKHLEPGHLDSLCFGSLQKSLNFLLGIGFASVTTQNQSLSQYAKDQFSSLGFLEKDVANRQVHSTIFNIKGKDHYQKLINNHVVCAQRGDGTRLSFHFYNTKDDVDRVVEILKK